MSPASVRIRPPLPDASGEIYGDVANIAARVQALAEPGAVLVTAQVQRQIAGLFVAEERGAHTLKGVPEPVRLFRLVRASGAGRRSRAAQSDAAGWSRRRKGGDADEALGEHGTAGDGQFMMIVGVAGTGSKSRPSSKGACDIRLRDTPYTWVEWAESSQLLQEHSPSSPISEWGRASASVAPMCRRSGASPISKARCKQVGIDPKENAPLLAPLVDVPLPARTGSLPGRGARGIPSPSTSGAEQSGARGGAGSSRWCLPSRICIGPIRPQSMF